MSEKNCTMRQNICSNSIDHTKQLSLSNFVDFSFVLKAALRQLESSSPGYYGKSTVANQRAEKCKLTVPGKLLPSTEIHSLVSKSRSTPQQSGSVWLTGNFELISSLKTILYLSKSKFYCPSPSRYKHQRERLSCPFFKLVEFAGLNIIQEGTPIIPFSKGKNGYKI